jgi:murein DD-endopeptidase MepM/ murein hydrolase activator NlpD
VIELTERQLKQVEERLKASGLTHSTLQEEFFDHLCCVIESYMASDYSFEKAWSQATTDFGEDEMKKLETETISLTQQNSILMKRMLISLAAGLLLLTTTLFSMQQKDPPSGLPFDTMFPVVSDFGFRIHPVTKAKKLHQGVDFKARLGTPIYATGNGVVSRAEDDEKYGNMVVIRHDDRHESLFAHMTDKLEVEAGQKVKKGDLIGYVGNSGVSIAPHLHYEVIKDGERVDPRPYLKGIEK